MSIVIDVGAAVNGVAIVNAQWRAMMQTRIMNDNDRTRTAILMNGVDGIHSGHGVIGARPRTPVTERSLPLPAYTQRYHHKHQH